MTAKAILIRQMGYDFPGGNSGDKNKRNKAKLLLITLFFGFALTVNSQIRIACIGNSITYGAGIKDPVKDSYPAVLQRMLGDEYKVVNFGVSGSCLLSKNSYAYRNFPRFEEAKSYQPDIVLIKLGTNDSKEKNIPIFSELEVDLSNMVDEFKQLDSKPEVILLYPVPVFRFIEGGINDTILRKIIIPAIAGVAKAKKLKIVDLYKVLSDKPQCYTDKVHPNEAGAILIAEEVYKILKNVAGTDQVQQFPGRKSDKRFRNEFIERVNYKNLEIQE